MPPGLPTLPEPLSVAWTASWLLALATVPNVLLQRRGRPTAALAWLFALFALPPVTLLAWWLLGRTHLQRRRKRRRRATETLARQLAEARHRAGCERPPLPDALLAVSLPEDVAEAVFPASGGNRVELLVDAERAYPAWEEAIAAAKHHVHALFYIWNDDATGRRLRDLLVERARAGVEVRLLVDDVGSPAARRGFFRPLTEAGGQVARFLPLRPWGSTPVINFRNHRKLLVVDGQVAFVGGINVGDEYYEWHDLAVALRGPAVDQVQEVFADDWFFQVGEELASEAYFGRWSHTGACCAGASSPDGAAAEAVGVATVASGPVQQLNAIREMLLLAVARTRQRLWITTPYLIPDPGTVAALRTAAYRGVDVRIMVPADSDVPLVRRAARAFYPALLGAGVRIFEYEGMTHAKAVVFDDELCLVGSANMDNRSFRLNFEASCFLASERLTDRLAARYEENLRRCREVHAEALERLPWGDQVLDAAAHLLSPLL